MLSRASSLVCLVVCVVATTITCEQESRGPISVDNAVSPPDPASGDSLHWEISVSNSGREVNLDSVRVREECVAGWAQGQWREIRIPDSMLTDTTVGAHASSVIYAQTSVVSNTGSTDVTMTNLATVYSNGGSSSDSVTYTVGRAAADLARGGPELTWLVERR